MLMEGLGRGRKPVVEGGDELRRRNRGGGMMWKKGDDEYVNYRPVVRV